MAVCALIELTFIVENNLVILHLRQAGAKVFSMYVNSFFTTSHHNIKQETEFWF